MWSNSTRGIRDLCKRESTPTEEASKQVYLFLVKWVFLRRENCTCGIIYIRGGQNLRIGIIFFLPIRGDVISR